MELVLSLDYLPKEDVPVAVVKRRVAPHQNVRDDPEAPYVDLIFTFECGWWGGKTRHRRARIPNQMGRFERRMSKLSCFCGSFFLWRHSTANTYIRTRTYLFLSPTTVHTPTYGLRPREQREFEAGQVHNDVDVVCLAAEAPFRLLTRA